MNDSTNNPPQVRPTYKPGDILEVDVVKIIPNGLGLAFAEGLTLFVPLSVPGDRLKVEIADLKGRTAFARIVEVLKAGNGRTEAPCEYFGECGGCDFQQMDYGAQLDAKKEILADSLRRIGKFDDPEIRMIASPEPFKYRMRTQVHADAGKKKIGFFRRQSHDVIEAGSCPILAPELDKAIRTTREEFDWSTVGGETFNIEAACAGGLSSVYSEEIFEPVDELGFEAFGFRYAFDARAFFQANRFMIEPLIEAAIGGESGEIALDLYCGIGLFAIPLASRFGRVVGVESAASSFSFAERNAASAALSNLELHRMRVKQFLFEKGESVRGADLVVVDPPRSGVKDSGLRAVLGAEPARISYVSCNPSTFARDIRTIVDAGYEADSITGLDLFPQTHHVEAVARLTRKV